MKPPFSVTNKMLNLIVEITQAATRLEIEQERSLLTWRKIKELPIVRQPHLVEDQQVQLVGTY